MAVRPTVRVEPMSTAIDVRNATRVIVFSR
jgi:hypothetical protein